MTTENLIKHVNNFKIVYTERETAHKDDKQQTLILLKVKIKFLTF